MKLTKIKTILGFQNNKVFKKGWYTERGVTFTSADTTVFVKYKGAILGTEFDIKPDNSLKKLTSTTVAKMDPIKMGEVVGELVVGTKFTRDIIHVLNTVEDNKSSLPGLRGIEFSKDAMRAANTFSGVKRSVTSSLGIAHEFLVSTTAAQFMEFAVSVVFREHYVTMSVPTEVNGTMIEAVVVSKYLDAKFPGLDHILPKGNNFNNHFLITLADVQKATRESLKRVSGKNKDVIRFDISEDGLCNEILDIEFGRRVEKPITSDEEFVLIMPMSVPINKKNGYSFDMLLLKEAMGKYKTAIISYNGVDQSMACRLRFSDKKMKSDYRPLTPPKEVEVIEASEIADVVDTVKEEIKGELIKDYDSPVKLSREQFDILLEKVILPGLLRKADDSEPELGFVEDITDLDFAMELNAYLSTL